MDKVFASTAGTGARDRLLVKIPVKGFLPVAAAFTVASMVSSASSPTYAASINPSRIDLEATRITLLSRDEDAQPSARYLINELKARTSLTWQQIGQLVGVSRRTVHNWAIGSAMNPIYMARVQDLLEQMKAMAHLRPFQIRKALLSNSGQTSTAATQPKDDPILFADQTPFRHNVAVTRTGKTRIKRS